MVVGRILTMVAALLVLATSLSHGEEKEVVMSLTLSSPAFAPNSEIPTVHTCDGSNKSPPLHWSGLPPGTKSLALIVDDPDAPDPANPRTTWVHWVLYDLPAEVSGLPAGASTATLPKGTREGINDWNRIGYGGPCPPVGRHRYFHKLYALDIVLADLGRPNKAQLLKAIEGHVISHAELVGTYERARE